MKTKLKKIAAGIMILLAVAVWPSAKSGFAQTSVPQSQTVNSPESFHAPEKKISGSFWKYFLWAAGVLLAVGVAGVALSSSGSSSDSSSSSGTGGFEGGW